MLLVDWLNQKGVSNGQFGDTIVRSAEAVRRYASGERIPDREAMSAIVRETGGAVTPNDFYGLTGHGEAHIAAQHAPSPDTSSENVGEAA